MDSFKQSILLVGGIIIVGMILCPPWMRVTPGLPTRAVGYSFLWNAPEVSEWVEPVEAPTPTGPVMGVAPPPEAAAKASGPPSYSIDWMRLLSQLGLAAMMTGVAMYVLKQPAGKNYGTLRKQVKENLR